MLKLKLNPDMLAVETFVLDGELDATRGTVRGQSLLSDILETGCCQPGSQQCQPTDYHVYSCGVSCKLRCFQTGGMPTCDA